jgi:hypothetical protein
MKKKTISDAVTNISAEYIEKAADYTVAKKSRKVSWYKWTAIAACLLLCLSIPFFTGLFDTNPPIIDNPSSQTTPNSDGNDGDFDAPIHFYLDGKSFIADPSMKLVTEVPSGYRFVGTVTNVGDSFSGKDFEGNMSGDVYLSSDGQTAYVKASTLAPINGKPALVLCIIEK